MVFQIKLRSNREIYGIQVQYSVKTAFLTTDIFHLAML